MPAVQLLFLHTDVQVRVLRLWPPRRLFCAQTGSPVLGKVGGLSTSCQHKRLTSTVGACTQSVTSWVASFVILSRVGGAMTTRKIEPKKLSTKGGSSSRTDPGEVKRSQEVALSGIRKRVESRFPRKKSPSIDPAARTAAMRRDWAKITGLAAHELAQPDATGSVADKAGGLRAWLTPEDLTFLATGIDTFIAEEWTLRPTWVKEAFVASVAVVRGLFGPAARGAPLACRLLTPDAAALMLEATGPGIQALHAHACRVTRLFSAFGARSPSPAIYEDIFLKVLVPTYNAVSVGSRLCTACGTEFKINVRSVLEVERSRHCPPCAQRVHSRESQRKRRAAPDVARLLRSDEQGDQAVASAERKNSAGSHWRQGEELARLIDEQHKDRTNTMTVKGRQKDPGRRK